jgi:23S rRNA (guanosine2251-2'-O)-methyltransferase
MRTADACGVELIYACGYTPYPDIPDDERPPHIAAANHRAIAKTALGAEHSVPLRHHARVADAIAEAKRDGFSIIVIEQAESSLNLFSFTPPSPKLALILGNEVTGVEPKTMAAADAIVEIPMAGQKESLSVSVAAAVAMYQIKYRP